MGIRHAGVTIVARQHGSTFPGPPEATLQAAGLKLIGTLTKAVSTKKTSPASPSCRPLVLFPSRLVVIKALGYVLRDSRVIRFCNGTAILFFDFLTLRVDRKIIWLERFLGC